MFRRAVKPVPRLLLALGALVCLSAGLAGSVEPRPRLRHAQPDLVKAIVATDFAGAPSGFRPRTDRPVPFPLAGAKPKGWQGRLTIVLDAPSRTAQLEWHVFASSKAVPAGFKWIMGSRLPKLPKPKLDGTVPGRKPSAIYRLPDSLVGGAAVARTVVVAELSHAGKPEAERATLLALLRSGTEHVAAAQKPKPTPTPTPTPTPVDADLAAAARLARLGLPLLRPFDTDGSPMGRQVERELATCPVTYEERDVLFGRWRLIGARTTQSQIPAFLAIAGEAASIATGDRVLNRLKEQLAFVTREVPKLARADLDACSVFREWQSSVGRSSIDDVTDRRIAATGYDVAGVKHQRDSATVDYVMRLPLSPVEQAGLYGLYYFGDI